MAEPVVPAARVGAAEVKEYLSVFSGVVGDPQCPRRFDAKLLADQLVRPQQTVGHIENRS